MACSFEFIPSGRNHILRQLIAIESHRVSVNLVQSEPSTSQSDHATYYNDKPEPNEPEVN